jgi:putative C protein alpha-antigen
VKKQKFITLLTVLTLLPINVLADELPSYIHPDEREPLVETVDGAYGRVTESQPEFLADKYNEAESLGLTVNKTVEELDNPSGLYYKYYDQYDTVNQAVSDYKTAKSNYDNGLTRQEPTKPTITSTQYNVVRSKGYLIKGQNDIDVVYHDENDNEIAPTVSQTQFVYWLHGENGIEQYVSDRALSKTESASLYKNYHENGSLTYTSDNGDQVSLTRVNDTKTVKEYATMNADDGFIDKQIQGYKAPDIPHAAIPGYSVYKVYTKELIPDENGYPVLGWVEVSTNEADYNHIHPLDRDDYLDVARKIKTVIPGAFIKRDVPVESISNPHRTMSHWRVVYKGSPLKPTFELPNEAPIEPALPEFHQALPNNAPVHELEAFEYAVPNEAPIKPALPEFHQAVPDNSPVHELEAFEFAVPNEAPVEPALPEFHQAVPDNAPIHEFDTFEYTVPNEAPIYHINEFVYEVPANAPVNEVTAFEYKVPEAAPIHEVIDFEYKVPETAPIHEITDFEYKVLETEPIHKLTDKVPETPVQKHVSNSSEQILPKTNSQSNMILILFGFVLFIFGLYFRTTVKN